MAQDDERYHQGSSSPDLSRSAAQTAGSRRSTQAAAGRTAARRSARTAAGGRTRTKAAGYDQQVSAGAERAGRYNRAIGETGADGEADVWSGPGDPEALEETLTPDAPAEVRTAPGRILAVILYAAGIFHVLFWLYQGIVGLQTFPELIVYMEAPVITGLQCAALGRLLQLAGRSRS